jgi:hypothetical protein
MKISHTLMLSLILGTQTLIAQNSDYREIDRSELIRYQNDSNFTITLIKSIKKKKNHKTFYLLEDKKTKKVEKVVKVSYYCPGCGKG